MNLTMRVTGALESHGVSSEGDECTRMSWSGQ